MAPSRDWACFVQRSINFKQLHPARRLLGNQYHIAGSPLLRFEWFRRKQQLHFVHHTHGNSNFAIIDNFWDRFLGTYRNPDPDAAENPPLDPWLGQSSRISRGDTISWTLRRQCSGPSIDLRVAGWRWARLFRRFLARPS